MPFPLMGLTSSRVCIPAGDASPAPAAELAIQSSVGVGGMNRPGDVLRIQEALNRVPTTQGGPTPPLVPDSWIGPNTCGAIKKFQVFHFGPKKADGRVDPDQYTIAKLRAFQSVGGPDAGCGCEPKGGSPTRTNSFSLAPTTTSTPACPANTLPIMDRVYASLPICQLWVSKARHCLNQAIQVRAGTIPTDQKADAEKCLDVVDRCFKVKGLSAEESVRAMRSIRRVFEKMSQVISQSKKPDKFFHKAPAGTERSPSGRTINAFTYPGGFTRRDANGNPPMSNPEFTGPNLSQNGIYMCEPSITRMNCDDLVDLLNHEMAHFAGPEAVGDRIQDPAGGKAALLLPHATAVRCASNYAWLAWLARLPMGEWMTNNG